MACNDNKHREWMNIPAGSIYELSVDGPAGFAAFAHFDDGGNHKIETWRYGDIVPGPRRKKLGSPGGMHVVFVYVDIESTQAIDVVVRATVAGKDYCRTVSGKAGTSEIIVHLLRMAKA